MPTLPISLATTLVRAFIIWHLHYYHNLQSGFHDSTFALFKMSVSTRLFFSKNVCQIISFLAWKLLMRNHLISYKINLNFSDRFSCFLQSVYPNFLAARSFTAFGNHICFVSVRGAQTSFWRQEIKRTDHSFSFFEQEKLEFKSWLPYTLIVGPWVILYLFWVGTIKV